QTAEPGSLYHSTLKGLPASTLGARRTTALEHSGNTHLGCTRIGTLEVSVYPFPAVERSAASRIAFSASRSSRFGSLSTLDSFPNPMVGRSAVLKAGHIGRSGWLGFPVRANAAHAALI